MNESEVDYSVQELLLQLKQDESWEENAELRELIADSLAFLFNV